MDKLAIIIWNDDGEPVDPLDWIDTLSDILDQMIKRGGFGAKAP